MSKPKIEVPEVTVYRLLNFGPRSYFTRHPSEMKTFGITPGKTIIFEHPDYPLPPVSPNRGWQKIVTFYVDSYHDTFSDKDLFVEELDIKMPQHKSIVALLEERKRVEEYRKQAPKMYSLDQALQNAWRNIQVATPPPDTIPGYYRYTLTTSTAAPDVHAHTITADDIDY